MFLGTFTSPLFLEGGWGYFTMVSGPYLHLHLYPSGAANYNLYKGFFHEGGYLPTAPPPT